MHPALSFTVEYPGSQHGAYMNAMENGVLGETLCTQMHELGSVSSFGFGFELSCFDIV
jgi:hypothetical protein